MAPFFSWLPTVLLLVQMECGSSAVFLSRPHASNSSAPDSGPTSRANEVRKAIQHLWSGYRMSRDAWGADEVKPISGEPGGNWGAIHMLALDTLDTLWLAGLKKEFQEGEELASKLDLKPLDHPERSSFFEITIRGLGGLLSAYALSGHKVFLDKAKQLGDSLLVGFPQKNNHAWPVSYIDVHNPTDVEVTPSFHRGTSYLADVGSNILEFSYLSSATGDARYGQAADSVEDKLVALSKSTPLAPVDLQPYSVSFASQTVSVGSRGDSYFEYLLKEYIQSGGKKHNLLLTWKGAMREMRTGLLKKSNEGLTYIAGSVDRNDGSPQAFGRAEQGMEHLSCFVGGMLAMASHFVPAKEKEDWWLPTGEEITRTCYEMYRRSPSGLAPDAVRFDPAEMNGMFPANGATNFRLRPETLESLFYLHRITGNATYRDWSWEIFQNINRQTKTKYGFAAVDDVEQVPVRLVDSEETFMGAETLKYALLAQLPAADLSLDKFVFNTEAHPFPVKQ